MIWTRQWDSRTSDPAMQPREDVEVPRDASPSTNPGPPAKAWPSMELRAQLAESGVPDAAPQSFREDLKGLVYRAMHGYAPSSARSASEVVEELPMPVDLVRQMHDRGMSRTQVSALAGAVEALAHSPYVARRRCQMREAVDLTGRHPVTRAAIAEAAGVRAGRMSVSLATVGWVEEKLSLGPDAAMAAAILPAAAIGCVITNPLTQYLQHGTWWGQGKAAPFRGVGAQIGAEAAYLATFTAASSAARNFIEGGRERRVDYPLAFATGCFGGAVAGFANHVPTCASLAKQFGTDNSLRVIMRLLPMRLKMTAWLGGTFSGLREMVADGGFGHAHARNPFQAIADSVRQVKGMIGSLALPSPQAEQMAAQPALFTGSTPAPATILPTKTPHPTAPAPRTAPCAATPASHA